MKKVSQLKTGDKVFLYNKNGELIKTLTFSFQGRDSINFVENNSCIFGKRFFLNKSEIEVKLNGETYLLKTWEE